MAAANSIPNKHRHPRPRASPAARLDLKIGFACNNHCLFCAQGDKRSRLANKPWGEIIAELEKAATAGVRGVVFTGGEPTLHPQLTRSVAAARALGYTKIQIQTNGRRFAYRDYCETLAAAGANEFSPSLHGADPETHDTLTRSPGAWRQVVAGLKNLKRLGLRVFTNTVVVRDNYKDLPKLARLLVDLRVDQFQFAFVHIVGSAARHRTRIVPRKHAAVPFMLQGLDIGRRAGIACFTEAVPLCLLPGREDYAAERMIPDGPVVDAGIRLESWRHYRTTQGKAKRPACRTCRHDADCEGPWREYPKLYGWKEFIPVRLPGDTRA